MRVLILSLFGFLLTGCSLEAAPVDAIDMSPDLLVERAPPGPLDLSPYPLHYDLDLTLDPRDARFGGTVTIKLDITEPATGLYLHGRDLVITEVRSYVEEGPAIEGFWLPALPSGVAWLDYGQLAEPGQLTIEIDYNAPFDANLSGLFKVTEQGDAYALAKSESIQARRFMPGFDQPAFKAPFDITLTIPDSDSAISNAPEKSIERLENGLKRVTFETTRPLPTYLLSLAVGSFDVVEAGVIPPNAMRDTPIPLRGFTRRGKGHELAFALETAPELVRIFEEALQQPYPYKKLDIVAAPQWPSGATELAAAITYRESRILAGEDIGPAARRSLLAIHAHEVGHMWFGNLVTPPWWDDLWLKEAFASWGEGASLSEMYPGEGYELDAIVDGIKAMELDSLSSARAVREPIALNENVRNAYDSITYNKGLAVIGMVDAYFGAEAFRPALGRYIEAFEDGVAGSPEFFEIIARETGEPDLTRAFRSFVEQNGLPLITIEQAGEAALQVRQSRYAPLGGNPDTEQLWVVPFCWVSGASDLRARSCSLLSDPIQTLNDDALALGTPGAPWILPNANGTGYYRFSMSYDMWQDLGRHFDALNAGEKLATLDSVGAEFAAGRIDVQTVWRFIDEAVRDEERRVVQAAIGQAQRFDKLVKSDPDARAAYQSAVADVFRARFTALDQHSSDDPELQILKSSLEKFLIRYGEDQELRQSLAEAAAAYIRLEGVQSDRALNTDEYLTAMAVGLQVYGAPFLDQMLIARANYNDPVFELAVAYAIGQNRDPALLERIFELAKSGELGSRESQTIIRGQMTQSETQAATWDWLKANLPDYLEVIPRQRKRSSPTLAQSMCSLQARDELVALFDTHGALAEGHERALTQTTERIELCAALAAAKGAEVRAYFKAKR